MRRVSEDTIMIKINRVNSNVLNILTCRTPLISSSLSLAIKIRMPLYCSRNILSHSPTSASRLVMRTFSGRVVVIEYDY